MKKKFILILTLALLFLSACTFGTPSVKYTATPAKGKTVLLKVNDEVDFTEYFYLTNSYGENIIVTDDMLDLSSADVSFANEFEVKLSYKSASCKVKFIVLDESGETNVNVMNRQNYAPQTLDKSNLQDKLLEEEGVIGLPSVGNYSALVVPVQFSGTTVSQSDLTKLDNAFNGSSTDTGWESVSSFYQKSSYGKLNLSFDIQPVYKSSKTASYYEKYEKIVDYGDFIDYQTGDEAILLEVLAYLEPRLDLTKYDHNKDGCIDAVYLIYSAPVEYETDSIYWAFVDWYSAPESQNKTFDGLDAYYYLFAGFDFMDEDTRDGFPYNGVYDGLKINAGTYIHETAHLLGLDDYYDYNLGEGSDEGVGCADMMDYTVGDHTPYSKLMMGWIEPTIINDSKTVTINSFQTSGDCLMLLLDYDGSYFCEYLLIDFYTADGLNSLHSSVIDSYLFDGAKSGVRIYHVSSWCNTPFSDEYGSFTDNNNSTTQIPLLKLIEADGESNFQSSQGYASKNDLWQAGDKLSDAFPSFCRHDGKFVNFDITIDKISNNQVTFTLSFKN